MELYQRLLLIVEPDLHPSAAMRRACALARASGAELHLYVFVQPPAHTHLWGEKTDEANVQRHLHRYRRWMAEEAALLKEEGLNVSTRVVWTTHPLLDILRCVEQLQPDLLIKDVTLEPLLKRVFTTPLDCHLLRDCPVPVHLVNQAVHGTPRQVLAAVDPSDPQADALNELIAQTAGALARQCDAPLHLLYACDLSAAFNGEASLLAGAWDDDYVEALRESLQTAFVNLAERCGVSAQRRHFVVGLPIPVLHELVDELEVDVVVMGTAHRVGLERLIGSTTERALYSIPGSLLAVRG
ncbi:universal stress protein [Pseudomonas mediterranea]|jgi:universal stress protein E|uniref:Universal stress protein E n=1 Tax=Pseudomonas mediterranea TaxID=183795 RepID=A0AAX2DFV3_9PSED|nr:universal stress protein [Pseudomonas mediterranea]KGU82590.1 universal stress protein [Pseudomonas mediterranea CFBP 5447]MBL0844242.1 universal stress protein [Pseudomonas mediterranea]QHA82284.1 universal stress protein [Pseudomonas mediterranea]UZE03113.1 universal stress protein [Pseudomonas mediterranea]SDU65674.1 universal stress protein E [Pseudomonas mediterranea]